MSGRPSLTTDRERQALDEMARTRVARGPAVLLVAAFLATIYAVPLVHLLLAPQRLLAFLARSPAAIAAAAGRSAATLNRELRERGRELERILEEDSPLTTALRGPLQLGFIHGLRAGNGRVEVGRHGHLFLRDDLEPLLRRGFLTPVELKRRSAAALLAGDRLAPDPRPPLVSLAQALGRRGIRLVVLPIPPKAAVYPELIRAERAGPAARLANPSHADLQRVLEAAGAVVHDPLPQLLAGSTMPSYQRLDTHWTPAGMQLVAADLARGLRALAVLPEGDPGRYTRSPRPAVPGTDLLPFLHLPRWAALAPDAPFRVESVLDREGRPWSPAPGAPVLLLGDSYSLVFSSGPPEEGRGAGLAEHLSLALGLPLDRIAASGAPQAALQLLARELERGEDRLGGVRVVVLAFAWRHLLTGNWPAIRFPAAPAGASAAARDSARVRVRIEDLARLPDPRDSPYRDALVAARVRVLQAASGSSPPELLVYLWGLRDARRVAELPVSGQTLELRLTPWAQAEREVGSIQRAELLDEASMRLAAYLGEYVEAR